MGFIKSTIAEKVIFDVAKNVAGSLTAQNVSEGLSRGMGKLADAIDEKERRGVIKAASEFKDMHVLHVFMDNCDTQYKKTPIFNRTEYSWQTYEYSVCNSDGESLFNVYIDRMNCTFRDLSDPTKSIYVNCKGKQLSKVKTYEVFNGKTLLDRVQWRSHIIDPKITNALAGKKDKLADIYTYNNRDWVIKETLFPHRAEIESRSKGIITRIRYTMGGIAIGYCDPGLMLNSLVGAFIPLIESHSQISDVE